MKRRRAEHKRSLPSALYRSCYTDSNMRNTRRRYPGFTIVELLIVVVVIGILAAIVIVAYNGVTQSARDAKRSADLNNIMKALELYHIDHGGYPTCGGSPGTNTAPYAFSASEAEACLADDLVPDYIAAIPVDPVNDGGSHVYHYASGYKKDGPTHYESGTASDNYILGVRQEATTSPTYGGWGHGNLTLLLGSSN
jgi:prepilin-type N-terminal cleavage/methylation domain-containing protein